MRRAGFLSGVCVGAIAAGVPPLATSLAPAIWNEPWDYADGTRLVAGDAVVNAGQINANPGNLGWDAIAAGAANISRFNPIVFNSGIEGRSSGGYGDFSSPGSYLLSPASVTATGNIIIEVEREFHASRVCDFSVYASDLSNRFIFSIGPTVGTSVHLANTTATGVEGVQGFTSKLTMGGTGGQHRIYNDPVEKFTAILWNNRVYMRRGPGFPVGAAASRGTTPVLGTSFTNPGGNRVGLPTLNSRFYNKSLRVAQATTLMEVNETFRSWVPKRRATAGSAYNTGTGDQTVTGTFLGAAPHKIQWGAFDLGTGAQLRAWEYVPDADTVIGSGTWEARMREIPVGINGRFSYALGFRAVDSEGRYDAGSTVISNRPFAVTLNIGIIGQSNAGGITNPVTGSQYPRVDGIHTYGKADPPNVTYLPANWQGSVGYWVDTVTYGNGKGIHVWGEALAAHLNIPISFEVLAIAATGSANLGPSGANWSYITTHHAYVGNRYEFLYLSQGENEFAGVGAYENYWVNINMPAYRDPAMHGQPDGTIIPLIYAMTGRYDSTPGGYTDVAAQALRTIQENFVNTIPNAIFSHNYTGIKMVDGFHYSNVRTEPGNNEAARRNALTMMKMLTGTGYGGEGPKATVADRAANIIDVTYTLNGATSIVARDGTNQANTASDTALTSWQVSADNFATTLTITSVAIVAGKVRITLAADPGGPVKVRNHYGLNPNITSWVFGAYADGTYIGSQIIVTPLVTT